MELPRVADKLRAASNAEVVIHAMGQRTYSWEGRYSIEHPSLSARIKVLETRRDELDKAIRTKGSDIEKKEEEKRGKWTQGGREKVEAEITPIRTEKDRLYQEQVAVNQELQQAFNQAERLNELKSFLDKISVAVEYLDKPITVSNLFH